MPINPILLFEETATCQSHDTSSILADVARLNNVIFPLATYTWSLGKEIDPVVELIMGILREVVITCDDREAVLGYVRGDFRMWKC